MFKVFRTHRATEVCDQNNSFLRHSYREANRSARTTACWNATAEQTHIDKLVTYSSRASYLWAYFPNYQPKREICCCIHHARVQGSNSLWNQPAATSRTRVGVSTADGSTLHSASSQRLLPSQGQQIKDSRPRKTHDTLDTDARLPPGGFQKRSKKLFISLTRTADYYFLHEVDASFPFFLPNMIMN